MYTNIYVHPCISCIGMPGMPGMGLGMKAPPFGGMGGGAASPPGKGGFGFEAVLYDTEQDKVGFSCFVRR